jgi:hypothetical protein
MDADLQQFVKEHLIKTNSVDSNESLELMVDRQQKLVDAGYMGLAQKTESDIKALKSLENAQSCPNVLLLKRPHFVFGPLKHRIITSNQVLVLSIIGLFASFGLFATGVFMNSAIDYSAYGYGAGQVYSSIGAGGSGDVFIGTAIIGMVGSIFGVSVAPNLLRRNESQTPSFTHLKLPNSSKLLVECETSDYLGKIPDGAVQTTIEMKKQDIQPKVWVLADAKEATEQVRGQLPRIVPLLDPLLVGYHRGDSEHVTVHAIWGNDIEDMNKLFSDGKIEEHHVKEALPKQEKASKTDNPQKGQDWQKYAQETDINEAIRNKRYLNQS